MILVDDVIANPQLAEGESAAGCAGQPLGGGAAAVNETPEGVDGEPELGADEALAQARLGEDQARLTDSRAPFRSEASSRSSP